MRKPQRREETPNDLRLSYIMCAAYSFYRAATADENLVSALNRMNAQNIAKRLHSRGIPVPTSEEVRQYAVGMWPPDRLHQ